MVSPDEPITELEAHSQARVQVNDVIESEAGNYISFADPDGNPIYVGDWDPDFDEQHEPNDAVGSARK